MKWYKYLLMSFVIGVTSCSDPFQNNGEKIGSAESLQFDVKPGFVESTGFQWLFISDSEGESSELLELKENSIITVNPPEKHNEGDTYILTLVAVTESNGEMETRRYYFRSFAELSPGQFILSTPKSPEWTGESVTQNVKIVNLPNVLPDFPSGAYGRGMFSFGSQDNNETGVLKFEPITYGLDDPMTFYIAYEGQTRYITLEKPVPGGDVEIDYTDMILMENSIEFSFNENAVPVCYVYGYDDHNYHVPTLLRNKRPFFASTSNHINYEYTTADPFDEYLTVVEAGLATSRNAVQTLGSSVASEFSIWNGEVYSLTIQDDDIVMDLSLEADIVIATAQGSQMVNEMEIDVWWDIILPGNKTLTQKVPQLPQSISEVVNSLPQEFNFSQVLVVDLQSESNYQDFIDSDLRPESDMALRGFIFDGNNRALLHWQEVNNSTSSRKPLSHECRNPYFSPGSIVSIQVKSN